MRTKTLFLTLSLVVCCFFAAEAQSTYKSAIGLRAGLPPAASFKQFISDQGAIEAFAGFYPFDSRYSWFTIGGMYQHHFPIGSIEGFQWYVGGGASMQVWAYKRAIDKDTYGNLSFGLIGVGGVDYKFSQIPLNVSADIMPTLFLGSDLYYTSAFRGYAGASARYTFR